MAKLIKTITMTVAEWIAVPDAPNQRDTVRHAAKARREHLKVAADTQRQVSMAVLPDGRTHKLDGHTRGHMWELGEILPEKDELIVAVYAADSILDVMETYKHFDNTGAVENSYDKLTSAYKEAGVKVSSELFVNGPVISALTALDSYFGSKYHNKLISLAQLIVDWKAEIETCDIAQFKKARFNAPLVAAMLVTVRRRGDSALGFWMRYDDGVGVKIGNSRDGVEALAYVRNEAKAKKSGRAVINAQGFGLLSTAISCYEAWRTERMYETLRIRQTDVAKYLNVKGDKK